MGLHCPLLLLVVLAGAILKVGVNSFSTTESSAHHRVQAIVNTAVDLPCDVNIGGCGSAVHSVKVYKNEFSKNDGSKTEERVFVLVRSNDTSLAMDNAEGVLARPKERAKFSLETDPPSLNINLVFLVDEGEYRCDVTYVQMLEGCRTTAKATLITLMRPDKPKIKYDDSDTTAEESRIGPFLEGTKLSLTCDAKGGKPPAQITWLNGSKPMASEEDEIQLGTGTVDVELTRADLRSRFQCAALNDALDEPYTTWVEVDVHVRPLKIEILHPSSPIVEDKLSNLTCEVRGARPAAAIVWLNGTEEIPPDSFTSEQIEESDDDDSDSDSDDDDDNDVSTYTTRSVFTFVARKHDYGLDIHCRGRNVVMETRGEDALEDTIELDVHYAPRVILEPSGFMAVNFSGSVELTCRFDANPDNVSKVRWQRDGLDIELRKRKKPKHDDDDDDDSNNDDENNDSDDDFGDDSDDDDDDDDDDGDGRSAKLRIASVTHSDKGVYTCMFENSVGRGVSTTTLTLDVYYPPVTKIELVPSLVHEHEEENVTMECDVESANPEETFAYRWFKDGELIAEDENDTLVLQNVDRFNVGNYSCSAQNEMGWGVQSEDEELVVMYLPGISTLSYFPPIVVKGKSVTVTCDTKDLGQPKATHYRWYRDDYILMDVHGPEMFVETVTTQVLSNFSCAAVNAAGEGPAARITIPLMAAPAFVQDLLPSYGVLANATNPILSCWVECSPICEISWLKNGQPIKNDSKLYTIKSTYTNQDPNANRLESVMSTLVWNMSAWPGKMLKRKKDDATYTCESTENFLGAGVSDSIFFRVEYPPENMYVSPTTIDVVEGTIPEEAVCEAHALPPPTYIWKYGDHNIVSSNPTLKLNYNVTREKSGNYTCFATNRYGGLDKTIFLNVLYKPTCNLTVETTAAGKVIVECKVDANPDDITYEWSHDNDNITDEVESDKLRSRLVFTESTEYYGDYQCIATNKVGSSDPCVVTVSKEGGWWEQLKKNKVVFIVAAVVAALLLLLVVLLIIVLLRRKSKSAGVHRIQLEERHTPEGVQTDPSHMYHANALPVVSFKKVDPPIRGPRIKYVRDDDDGTTVNGKKKKAALPKEPDSKTFYENLPFHGMQAPPNKHTRPIPAPRKHSPMKPVYENMSYFPKLFTQPMFKRDKPFKPILPDLEYADVDFPARPLNNNQPFSKAKIVEKILEEADDDATSGKTPARPPRSKPSTRK